jgi:hypothetical protein
MTERETTVPRAAVALMGAAIVARLVAAAAQYQTADLDMYHEMALFRAALELGALPRDDIFAYTPTVSPSVHHEWGTGAILYLVAIATGWGGAGVLALRALLVAATATLCVTVARRRGTSWSALAVASPFAMALFAPGLSTLRAHVFTFLFLACLLLLFEVDRTGRRWWVVPWLAIFVVWINLHGGFVVGLGLLGVYVAERAWRRHREEGVWRIPIAHLAALVLPLPLLMVNPYGWDYVPYLWDALLLDRPLVAEWAPLWSGRAALPLQIVFGAAVVVALYAVARDRNRDLRQISILLVTGLATVTAQRLVPVFGVVWLCYVPPLLARTDLTVLVDRLWARHWRPIAAAAVVLITLSGYQAIDARVWDIRVPTVDDGAPNHYPAGAVRYLEEQRFSGNLMTPFNSGAYVMWHLYPAVRVGMDSRYEVAYPPEAATESHLLYGAALDWRAVLEGYGTDAILLPAGGALDMAMSGAEKAGGDWKQVYRDDGFALFAPTPVAEDLPRVDRRGEEIVARFP